MIEDKTTLMGKTIPELIEIISWWETGMLPTDSELLQENIKMRAKISLYEARIKQMAEVAGLLPFDWSKG